jgi:hypothetical protein
MRSAKYVILPALLLALVSPFIAGLLAWAYVDQANRTGPLYWWFYTLAYQFPQQIGIPAQYAILSAVAIHFGLYIVSILLLLFVLQLCHTALKQRSTQS